jgi:ferritin
MISSKMQEAMSEHISAEFYSAYLYLSMSAFCEAQLFKGFGRWLRVQYNEELSHAAKMLDYLLERGGDASLKAVGAPPAKFDGMLHVFESVLAHERHVSELIGRLYETAAGEHDVQAQIFLQWFLNEQVEEEARAVEIVGKLKMVTDRPASILYLDKEYGKRTA